WTRDLLLLGAVPLLGASWWFVRRFLETGHMDAVFVMGTKDPLLLRAVAPDWFGVLETFAHTTKSWLGWIGVNTTPGDFMVLVGTVVPATLVGGSVLAACSTATSHRDRALVGSFLGGLVVMIALM